MSEIALKMWQTTFKTFMEHDLDLLSKVLDEENKLNELEKEITSDLIELSHTSSKKDEKDRATIYLDAVEDLELIGDYCKDILERVQIKIEEKLLFSDEAVKEYSNLYHKTEEALKKLVGAMAKYDSSKLEEVLKDETHIEELVDEYRKRHNQRLINGICSPLACNMFLNMLDFTGQIFHHTKSIAKNILEPK
jgi:phosphate:Na+ symporter